MSREGQHLRQKGVSALNAFTRCKLATAMIVAIASGVLIPEAAPASAASAKTVSVGEAMERAAKTSADVQDAKANAEQKRMEYEQAKAAVTEAQAKANGPFAKAKNLSQDLQLRMKVPEARSQLLIAGRKLDQALRMAGQDAEKSYLQAYQDRLAEDAASKKTAAAAARVKSAGSKAKFGLADPDEKKEAQTALDQAASDYKVAQLTAKASRLALGGIIGMNLELPIEFAFQPDYADLSQKALNGYIAGGLKTSVPLLQAAEARKLADAKLAATRSLYRSKFGSGTMKVMDMLLKQNNPDPDLLKAGYEATLARIQKQWEGFFLLLGFIPIPKALLKGEYDGLSYLDDLKNALPIAALERDKAVKQESQARSDAIAAVRQSYLAAKGAEEAYAQALRDRDKAAAAADQADKRYKLGLMKADEVQQAKDARQQAEDNIGKMQIAYRLAVMKLDADTGGSVQRTVKPGVLPYKDIDSGLDPVKPQKAEPKLGSWELKPAVGVLVSELSVKPLKTWKATDYEVYSGDGRQLAGKTKITKSVRLLGLFAGDPQRLQIVLYGKKKQLGVATVTGSGAAGKLELKPDAKPAIDPKLPSAAKGMIIAGTFKSPYEAFTNDVYKAAAASIAKSGQGIYFQPQGDKTWYRLDQATDGEAALKPDGGTALAPDDEKALKVEVVVDKPGAVKTALKPDELKKQLETLAKDKEKLEADKQAAVDAQKMSDAASIAAQLQDTAAQIGMLEALQKGDAKAAWKQMAKVNNPEAAAAALAAGADGAAAGEGKPDDGTSGGSEPGHSDAEPPSELELSDAADAAESQLAAAISAGDAAAAAKQAQDAMKAAFALAEAQGGTAEALQTLAEAKAKTSAALEAASASGDTAQAAQLAATLKAVQDAALRAEKDALFAKLDLLQEKLDELTDPEADGKPAPGTPQEAAEQQTAAALQQLVQDLIGQVEQKELAKYSPEELAALQNKAELIDLGQAAASGLKADAKLSAAAVQSIISGDFDIKLDVPPVVVGDNRFLPLRAVAESFGATVDWDDETQTATVTTENGTVSCTIGSMTAYVDGDQVEMDMPAVLVEGRTQVPLRLIAESIGLQVNWNGVTQTVQIAE